MTTEAEAYSRHMNLKIAAKELGLNWQTLYCRLKKQGVVIAGDKLRYGSDRDKLGHLGESLFKSIVPYAVDNNLNKFQAKYDFDVLGHKVDVKASKPRQLNKKFKALSWSFSFKKQSLVCDFIVCFCLSAEKEIVQILLVPSEFFKGLQTVSVSMKGDSKWLDYSVTKEDLHSFFTDLPTKGNTHEPQRQRQEIPGEAGTPAQQ